ncbi:hypothetical protein ACFPN2_24900 [Steroidobacter flavus]|uniref:Peptidase S9 prolyl oligopeptidase catalytic domain-containing protein n=1 Tax=Steroidobacter flavus TaxID=1842136 RepID=A0ABV8SZX2_9GAMM
MVRRPRLWEAAIGGFLAMLCAVLDAAPITVREATETARIMELRDGNPVSVSPDGQRFALMVVRGDVAKDGVWLEILSGDMSSIATRGSATLKARLFSRGFGDPENLLKTYLTLPRGNALLWEDARHALFFWPDADNIVQVFRVNVDSGETAAVTHHSTDVSTFALSIASTGALLYSARTPPPVRPSMERGGFAVQSEDIFSLLRDGGGEHSLLDRWNIEWFVQSPGAAPRRLNFTGDRTQLPSKSFLAQPSPDGRYAIVDGAPERIPPKWADYREPWLQSQVREALDISPKGFIARQIAQPYLVSLDDGSARPLLNAPLHRSNFQNVLWSADSSSVIVGPTFIPLELLQGANASQEGLLHVDIASGEVTVLPYLAELASARAGDLQWVSEHTLRVGADPIRACLEYTGAAWRQVANSGCVVKARPGVRFEIRQSLNDPPRLFVSDSRQRRSRMILDPNPRLRDRYSLGRVETVRWQTKSGGAWRGLLYYPVDYQRGKTYPLVIQTHGVQSESEFNLYGWGPGTGPGISLYAAQMLAGKGMLVLQTQAPMDDASQNVEPRREGPEAAEGYVAAIDLLASRGLVDRGRVGLTGFSRTGWHALYALTHSTFPYAAAIASDNINGGYVEATFATQGITDAMVGAPPFGEGLHAWLRESPAFNVERIRAPLRMELQSGPLESAIYSWEIFSRLRRLGKPVEFYISPHIERGSHQVQNPSQILACKDGAIDWLDFWLNGREGSDAVKGEQYARWRKLRTSDTN